MKQILIYSLLLIGTTVDAQTSKREENDSVSIHLNGHKIQISQKRIDSFSNLMLEKFSALLADKEVKQSINKTMVSLEEKMYKALEILVEDKSQLQKAKTELKKAFVEAKPSLDTAFRSLKYQLDQIKKSKSN